MPEHYAVMEIDQILLTPQTNVRYIRSPLDGFVQDVVFSVGAPVPSDAVFDVMKNGVSLWSGSPASRPKIVSGQSSGQVAGVDAAIAKGDILRVDLVTVPAGGLPIPFVSTLVLYDEVSLRGQVVYTTPSIADGTTHNADIPNMGRGWKLVSAAADRACWVRGYVSGAARSADAARVITEDAGENAGLCAEIIFTASLLSLGYGAPFPEGFNIDDPDSTDGLFAITNRSGAAHTVQVTFERLVTER